MGTQTDYVDLPAPTTMAAARALDQYIKVCGKADKLSVEWYVGVKDEKNAIIVYQDAKFVAQAVKFFKNHPLKHWLGYPITKLVMR